MPGGPPPPSQLFGRFFISCLVLGSIAHVSFWSLTGSCCPPDGFSLSPWASPLRPPESSPLVSPPRRRSRSRTMSSYYEPQGWQAPSSRQVSWEQPAPPSRSGMLSSPSPRVKDMVNTHTSGATGSSSVSQREESPAFSSQFDGMDTFPFSLDSASLPTSCTPDRCGTVGIANHARIMFSCRSLMSICFCRDRPCDRQPRQERQAVECSSAGFDAHDDGPGLSRLRYVALDEYPRSFLTVFEKILVSRAAPSATIRSANSITRACPPRAISRAFMPPSGTRVAQMRWNR